MNVQAFKLITGDDIIGDVVWDYEAEEMIIEQPAGIHMQFDGSGRVEVALIPWVLYSEQKKFKISFSNILCQIDPNTELVNQWNQQFGRGLVVPSSGKQIIS